MTRLATVINKIIDIINTKQPTLVSGENIKKLNGTDIVGSGNIPVKTVGGESILGDGNVGVKTINGETMIGSGDAEIVGTGTLTTTSQNVIGAINEHESGKATKAELTTAQATLNGRIDNIIAGGTAPSEAEIVDARQGTDGTNYASLGGAIRGQVTDVKSDLTNIGVPVSTPMMYSQETYNNAVTGLSLLSDGKIAAGSILKSVSLYASAAVSQGAIYLIRDSDKKCVKQFLLPIASGYNHIELNYLCNDEVRVGVYNLNLNYTNSGVDAAHAFSSSGLTWVSPSLPDEGDTVTLDPHYSGKFAVSIQWETITNYIEQVELNKQSIEQLQDSIESTKVQPTIYDDLTEYANVLNDRSCLSDIEIPANTYIEQVDFYSSGTVVNGGGAVFVIRKSDNVCLYRKTIYSAEAGWNTVDINYYEESACYIGLYGIGVKYTNTAVDTAHAFSTKIHTTNPYVPAVGSAVTITDYFSYNFALSVKWKITSGIGARSEANSKRIEQLERGKIYDHPCIVSFIDDDTGKYVPTIWGEILAETNIRMGFACVTGFMAGLETPPEIYEQMNITDLQALYNNGHEIYSHSYSHPAFYSSSTSIEEIERQCRLSKQWLEANGFTRNANTIVYPGGLGENETAKQNVVRQFYHYGVDTVGGGVNPEPITNDLCIYRYNADTATLAELKDKVDDAIAEKKLLVFMNHAYELNRDKVNQVQKMIDIIDYIKDEGGLIIPLNEALHRIYGW